MTTDITELAQRVKTEAAAIDDTQWYLAKPSEIRSLVEALKKAQGMESYWKTQCRGITDHCEELQARIAELESRTVTAAAADVLAERKRQVTAEEWTPGHDDEYEHGELADAAGCYALSSELFDCAGEPPRPWPWPDEWWKPTSRRRDLVKAGALILAEIERIDRAATLQTKSLTTINHAPALVSLPKKGESLSGSSPVNDVTAGKQLTSGDVVTSLDRQQDDYVMVLKNETLEMAVAGGEVYAQCESVGEHPTDAARQIWREMVEVAMLAAAPQEVK